MTKKQSKCEDCKIRPIDYNTQGRDSWACTVCFDYAGEENRHTDEDHANRPNSDDTTDCPVCKPELDMRYVRTIVARDLSKWPVEKTDRKNRSHKDCGHPLTKVERAKCRAGKTITEAEKTLKTAEKQGKQAARIVSTLPSAPVSAAETKSCPKCGATGDNACTTASGGRVRSNGGRHPQRDA